MRQGTAFHMDKSNLNGFSSQTVLPHFLLSEFVIFNKQRHYLSTPVFLKTVDSV